MASAQNKIAMVVLIVAIVFFILSLAKEIQTLKSALEKTYST
jgi:hypothetical protein